jgi:hypothetical protein
VSIPTKEQRKEIGKAPIRNIRDANEHAKKLIER